MAAADLVDEVRARIEAALDEFLIERRGALPGSDPLIGEIERVLSSGGKRIRPLLCYFGYRAAGGRDFEAAVKAAAALELLHTFAIVHDDIMDAAPLRRGMQTTHARSGVPFGILVGDLALVLADHLFFRSGFPPEVLLDAFSVYSDMRQEVMVGQLLDLSAPSEPSVEQARRIATMKSGRYSVREPLLIGAQLARASDEVVKSLHLFGDPLGEAFQIRDDLLGTFGRESLTGKPSDSDAREGKRHVLFATALASLRDPERGELLSLWGGGDALGPSDLDRIRSLLISSGAVEASESLIAELVDRSAAHLRAAPVDPKIGPVLLRLARLATARDR